MRNNFNEKSWQDYLQSELLALKEILAEHNYVLDSHQPHILGERFLMQNITTKSGSKIILIG